MISHYKKFTIIFLCIPTTLSPLFHILRTIKKHTLLPHVHYYHFQNKNHPNFQQQVKQLERQIINEQRMIYAVFKDIEKRLKKIEQSSSTTAAHPPSQAAPTTQKTAMPLIEFISTLPLADMYKQDLLEKAMLLQQTDSQTEKQNLTRYFSYITQLPWSKSSQDMLDSSKACFILNRDHYGMEKVKKTILRFIAVQQLLANNKKNITSAPIFCLVGPPGTGKTSIAQSIAACLDRKFFSISVGGMHDSSILKGHSRTYANSLPGRMIHGFKIAGTNNPVILIDEIDKTGSYIHTENTLAPLLEILDPEQNNKFWDHYLNFPFDISKALFVATANDWDTIAKPLQDRMEKISLPGYTPAEKKQIALGHLLPKLYENAGLPATRTLEPFLDFIIRTYAQQPGIRDLKRTLNTIIQEQALATVEKKPFDLNEEQVKKILDHFTHTHNPRLAIL
ncbi:MAG TPA: AAA family ATPase [Candidatus Bathyarchaeia archaeon]|nr:AAA family ATPase [Candidatus Bathyarchaeia archaeon]